jgi:hypothetical protein
MADGTALAVFPGRGQRAPPRIDQDRMRIDQTDTDTSFRPVVKVPAPDEV